MDPVSSVHSAAASTTSDTTTTPSSTTDSSTSAGKSFASYLKDGESLKKVDGHTGFEKIVGGSRSGQLLNISGNKRTGEAFKVQERDGTMLHVYAGATIVMNGKSSDAAATTTTSSDDSTTTTGAASSASGGATAAS